MFGWFSAAGRLRLPLEPPQAIRSSADERRRQHLDRDVAFEPGIARPVDLAHAARAERREDLVGTDQCSSDDGHCGGL